jgi:hypothetical protein
MPDRQGPSDIAFLPEAASSWCAPPLPAFLPDIGRE